MSNAVKTVDAGPQTDSSPGSGSVAAELERPIPLLGRHAQYLGEVRRLVLSLEDGSIRQLELTTAWQTLQLHQAAVSFDEQHGVFRLQRLDRRRCRGRDQSSSPR